MFFLCKPVEKNNCLYWGPKFVVLMCLSGIHCLLTWMFLFIAYGVLSINNASTPKWQCLKENVQLYVLIYQLCAIWYALDHSAAESLNGYWWNGKMTILFPIYCFTGVFKLKWMLQMEYQSCPKYSNGWDLNLCLED